MSNWSYFISSFIIIDHDALKLLFTVKPKGCIKGSPAAVLGPDSPPFSVHLMSQTRSIADGDDPPVMTPGYSKISGPTPDSVV